MGVLRILPSFFGRVVDRARKHQRRREALLAILYLRMLVDDDQAKEVLRGGAVVVERAREVVPVVTRMLGPPSERPLERRDLQRASVVKERKDAPLLKLRQHGRTLDSAPDIDRCRYSWADSGPTRSYTAPARPYATSVPTPVSPPASSLAVRAVMQGNRSRDTSPEVALRSELHRRGLRFRKHTALVPGLRFRPDVVFPRQRIAVECLGCFWHRCPAHGVTPATNSAYWRAKLERNVERDRRNAAALAVAGWELVVVWEHEDPVVAADRVEGIVRGADGRA